MIKQYNGHFSASRCLEELHYKSVSAGRQKRQNLQIDLMWSFQSIYLGVVCY